MSQKEKRGNRFADVSNNDSDNGKSSKQGFFGTISSFFSSQDTKLRTCPHCNYRSVETDMIQHLKHCESTTYSVRLPDDSMQTFVHQSTNQISNATLSDGAHDSRRRVSGDFVESNMSQYDQEFEDGTHNISSPPDTTVPIHHVDRNVMQNTSGNQRKRANEDFDFCQRCGDLDNTTNMLRHAEQCQKVKSTFQSPDGVTISIYYAGPNESLLKKIRRCSTDNSDNSPSYH